MIILTYCERTKNIHKVEAGSRGLVYLTQALSSEDLSDPTPYCLMCGKPMIKDVNKATPKDILLGELWEE